MRKILQYLLITALMLTLAVYVIAAPAEPQITMQPQNYQYPQYSVAMYSVEATGTNLYAIWYLEYEGKTYNLSDNTNGVEPWEGYAGEKYGPINEGNTFGWFFGGIEEGLNGAQIWCVIEDGHYSITSERALITVQGDVMPPEILKMPAALTVQKGERAEARCVAKSVDNSQLEFQWYETSTGKLPDIRAISDETSDTLFFNTQTTGTQYYVCCVTSSAGGRAYSSVLPVTVTDSGVATEGKAPTFQTKTLPQGRVGEDYGFTLETDDHGAVFNVSYNPGGANDFEKTGLVLTQEGMLAGKLTKAGTYTFTVCVSNTYGEDYGVLTLTVVDSAETTPTTQPEETQASTTQEVETTEVPDTQEAMATEGTTTPTKDKDDDGEKGGNGKWLLIVCVGVAAVGIGVGLGIIIGKKKK